MSLYTYAIHKPITTVMVALCTIVLGFISLTRLPLEYAPSLSWPSMYINVSYPSSSPEEVERRITRPLEEALGTLPRVKGINASSYDSRSSIRLEFDYNADMDLMAVQVRDRIDQAREYLPDDVDRVEVRRWNTEDFPVLTYNLTWLGDDRTELTTQTTM